jgi:hypothetical protein
MRKFSRAGDQNGMGGADESAAPEPMGTEPASWAEMGKALVQASRVIATTKRQPFRMDYRPAPSKSSFVNFIRAAQPANLIDSSIFDRSGGHR